MLRAICVAALVAMTSGCAGSEVKLVLGSVSLNGAPLDRVSVCFWPVGDSVGTLICPAVESDGTFEIVPLADRGQGNPGNYRVTVKEQLFDPEAVNNGMAGYQLPRIGSKYAAPEKTPLQVALQAGENELEGLNVTSDMAERNMFQQYAHLLRRGDTVAK